MKPKHIYTKTTAIEYLNLDTHCHEAHHQLIYMIKGTLHIKVEDTQHFLPERFIGLIPAKQLHKLQSRNEMIKMFLVYYPASIPLERFSQLNSNEFVINNLRYLSKLPSEIGKTTNKEAFHFCCAFIDLLQHMKSLQSFPIKGYLAPKNDRLKSVLNYIEKNYAEKLILEDVAEQFGFSVRNLTRLFKKENISFNNYINHLRIIHAIEKFTDSNENIEEVAFEVGYGTASNFSRTFKKYTGITPSNFIKANTTKSFTKQVEAFEI